MYYFDRSDVCDACYMFATLYHGGMGSREYRLFGRLRAIRYRPAPSLTVEALSENGRAIFDGMVSRAGFPAYRTWQGAAVRGVMPAEAREALALLD